jgi:hypothetical protein
MWGGIKTLWVKKRKMTVPPAPATELTPHVVFFSVPASFDYEEFKVGTYKGLLYLEALGAGAEKEGRLLTVWRDKRAYEAANPRFLDDTGLTNNNSLWEGFHLRTSKAEKSRWKRLSPSQIWAVVVTIFLALGYVEKVRDASGWLIGPPRIETSSQSTPIDVLIGEPFKFEVTVRNTRPLGDCFIEFLDVSADEPSVLALDPLALRSVPAVKPDSKAVLPVLGKAMHEGKSKVVIRGQATAGLIPSKQEFRLSSEINVWPPLKLGLRHLKDTTADGKLCEVEFEFHPGRRFPLGVEAEAKLERVPDVRFIGVRFPGTNDFTPCESWKVPGKEVATLEWRTPELVPMRRMTFSVLLESVAKQGKTRDEWEVVIQGIYCAFNEAH